jgi:hypothetical protein
MAETALSIGHGSSLKLGSGGESETFTAIDGVTSISFGSNKVDILDNTEMLTSGNNRVYQSGLEDAGDVTIKLNVRPGNTSQTALKAAKDGDPHNFQAVYPGEVWQKAFAGFIQSIDEDFPDDKKPTWTVKIKISGVVTESAPS